MPIDLLTIHFQHLEKVSVSSLHIVTLAKTGDDEITKPHLNIADTQLFLQVSVPLGLGQIQFLSKGNLCQSRIVLVSTMLGAMF